MAHGHKVKLLEYFDIDTERYLKHLGYTFQISGFSRALLHEFSRACTWKPTVKSTRYTLKELKAEFPFVFENTTEVEEDYSEELEEYLNTLSTVIDAISEITIKATGNSGGVSSVRADLILYLGDLWKTYKGCPNTLFIDTDTARTEKYCVMTDNDLVNAEIVKSLDGLRSLVASGISNDKAKYALPDAYRTAGTYTVQYHGLKTLLQLRTAPSALWEFRYLAREIFMNIPDKHKHLYYPKEEMMSKLKHMFDMQNSLNKKAAGEDWINGFSKEGRKITWLRYCRGELGEAMESTPYPHWRHLNDPSDIDNMKTELIDAWHFLMSAIIEYHANVMSEIDFDGIMGMVEKYIIEYSIIEKYDMETFLEALEKFTYISLKAKYEPESLEFSLISAIKHFFEMCQIVEMNFNELHMRYMLKNMLNFFRQEHGYREGTYMKVIDGIEDNKRLVDIYKKNRDKTPEEIVDIYGSFYTDYISKTANQDKED